MQVVAGVNPKKVGTDVQGIPIRASVADAVAQDGANAAFIIVPASVAGDAILEAAAGGVPFIVCVTEHITMHRQAEIFNTLKRDYPNTRLLGPNRSGILSAGKCNIGFTPTNVAMPGSVGIVSRSGTLAYQSIFELTQKGIGQTTCVGIGGDPVPGTSFIDCLRAFQADPGNEGHHHDRRDRRVAGRRSRRIHQEQRDQAGRRLYRGCDRAARTQDGARGRDHQRVEGHGEGQDGSLERGRRARGAEPEPEPDLMAEALVSV